MRRGVVLVLIVAGLLAAMASTAWLSKPAAVRVAGSASQFDAVRAKGRLARVLGDQQPHPADSAASDGVRERLLAELTAMGVRARIADRFACNELMKGRGTACARVRNVIVTLGPAAGRHVLVNTHYDSVPVGPGASDAGLGVATGLELAELLKNRRLARPVTLLFNEGEELGLVGARAFLDADPLSGQVDSLINLEARGTTGPVNMFETSMPNAAPVRLFGETVDQPVANSLAVSAYRQLPNYTDVNSFASRGWLTLNLAPVGNETSYHSPGDDLQAVDTRTLQHMGDQALALATRLANGPVPPQTGGEQLFMSLPDGTLWTLPMTVGVVVLAGLVLLFLVSAWRRGALWAAVPLMIAAVAGGTALAWLGLSLVGAARAGQFWRAYPQWTELAIYAGVIAWALALLALARRLEVSQLRVAFWLVFVLFGLVVMAAAPGGIVYFLFPPLVMAGGILARRWSRGVERLMALLAGALLFLTLGAMLGLLEELLNGGPLWAFAPLGALVLLPWLIETKPLIEELDRRAVLAGAGALLVAGWGVAAAVPAYSADRQQQWTLQYVAAADGSQPVWSIVNDRAPLPAAFERFGRWEQRQLPALGKRLRWVAPALPKAGLVRAQLLPASSMSIPGGRRVRVQVRTNGADSVTLVASQGARVVAAGAPGQLRRFDPEATDDTASLSCTGRSCDGAIMELQVRGDEPLLLTVLDTRWRLPASAAPLMAARPRHARAQYLPDATILMSRTTI